MIDKFLSAKHWQIFILLFGIPFFLQIFMMQKIFSVFAGIQNQGFQTQPDFGNFLTIILVASVIYMIIFYAWIWSMGLGLQSKIPQHLSMNVSRFKMAVIYPPIYIALFFSFVFSTIFSSGFFLLNYFAFIIPFHLLAMFCTLYSFYFVGKTIKTAELKEKTSFSDFAGEFFLLWFYPIGVWILQPRVNRINGDLTNDDIEQHLVE